LTVFFRHRSGAAARYRRRHRSAEHTAARRRPLPVQPRRHGPRHARQAAGAAARRPGRRHPERHGAQRQRRPGDGPRETNHGVFDFGRLGREGPAAGGRPGVQILGRVPRSQPPGEAVERVRSRSDREAKRQQEGVGREVFPRSQVQTVIIGIIPIFIRKGAICCFLDAPRRV